MNNETEKLKWLFRFFLSVGHTPNYSLQIELKW